MCDHHSEGTELILTDYNAMQDHSKQTYDVSPVLEMNGGNKSEEEVVSRKRKTGRDLQLLGFKIAEPVPVPKDNHLVTPVASTVLGMDNLFLFKPFKIQRKTVEKVHLSVISPPLSSISTSIPQYEETEVIIEDDDTEKYLTNSSKKLKQSKMNKGKDASLRHLSKSDEQTDHIFHSSSMQVVKGDYGEQLVVTLYPSSNPDNPTKDDQETVVATSNISYANVDESNTALFLTPSYSTEDAAVMETGSSVVSDIPGIDSVVNVKSLATQKYQPSNGTSFKEVKRIQKRATQPLSSDNVEDPVRQLWVTMKTHKEQLKQNGHSWTTGTWSNEEVDILRANISNYCLERCIDNPVEIIFNTSKEDRKDFYPTISAGLNRPLFAVYRRVRRMYDMKNHKGRYTGEEVEKLKKLRKMYGHDWSLIARHLGRSSDSVKDRCRLIKNSGKGKWSLNEENRLIDAVHNVTNTKSGESVTGGISWSAVAAMVQTRSEKQCRAKWLNYLNWKTLDGQQWTKDDDRLLIQKIAKLNVKCENEVDWGQLCEGWKSARSPQWLRCKWNSLKKMVGILNNMTFSDTVYCLEKLYFDEMLHFCPKSKVSGKSSSNLQVKLAAKFFNDESLQKMSVEIIDKEGDETDDSSNITTTIISQSGDTSNAPLFVQNTDSDHLISTGLLNPSSCSATSVCADSSNSNCKTTYGSTHNGVLCERSDGPLTLSQGTYHLTPTASEGIYIIQASDASSSEHDATLSAEDDRYVNITLGSDVLSSMLKLNGEKLQAETSAQSYSHCVFDSSLSSTNDYNSRSSDSSDNPVLSSIAHDVTIGSPCNSDDDAVTLLRDSNPLTGSLL